MSFCFLMTLTFVVVLNAYDTYVLQVITLKKQLVT